MNAILHPPAHAHHHHVADHAARWIVPTLLVAAALGAMAWWIAPSSAGSADEPTAIAAVPVPRTQIELPAVPSGRDPSVPDASRLALEPHDSEMPTF